MIRTIAVFALALSAACQRKPAPLAALEPPQNRWVRAQASAPFDGSEQHPFASLQAAVNAAPPNAVLHVAAGEYAGALGLERPITILGEGPSLTKLQGAVSSSGARVELRGLSISASPVALSLDGASATLTDVALSDASEAALSARRSEVVWNGGAISRGGEKGRGIDFDGGSLEVRRLVCDGAGLRAIVLHGGRGLFEELEIRHSLRAALQVTDGAEARVTGGHFADIGGAALYAGAAKLRVSGANIERVEYGVMGSRGSEVQLDGAQISGYAVAGVAFVNSHGAVLKSGIAHGGSEAAITVIHADGDRPVLIENDRIQDPGPMGLHVTESQVTARGNIITGARLDRQRELGDGLYSIDAQLVLEDNVLRGNAGSGATTLRTRLVAARNTFIENGRAGLLLLHNSTAAASGNLFVRNDAGVELAEAARADLSRNRFGGNVRFDIDAGCGQDSGKAETDDRTLRIRACTSR